MRVNAPPRGLVRLVCNREATMFKDLLVATTGHGDDAAALAVATSLAAESAAHVTVLVQARFRMPAPDPGAMGVFPVGDYRQVIEEALCEGEAERARWEERLRREDVAGEVRFSQAFPSDLAATAAMHARYCDLALIGLGVFGSLPGPVHDQFAKLLLASGRPVLAVPHGWTPVPLRRVVVGWHPVASAVRAVHDALEWLQRAREVEVVCVADRGAFDGHGEEPGADFATHLARHGIRVVVQRVDADGRDPGAMLMQRAAELGADLLVAGGYGHSRLREWALGGTTRYLLQNASMPVFFSH
jgi:nucleotide-binding universal stress UspA family protein